MRCTPGGPGAPLAAVVLAVTLLIAGCASGDGRSHEEDTSTGSQPARDDEDRDHADRDALSEQLAELWPVASEASLAPDEVECLEQRADGDGLELEGLFTDASAAGDARRVELVGLVIGCLEDPASSPWMLAAARTSLLTPALPSVSDEEARCAATVVLDTDEPARTLMGLDVETGTIEAMLECLTPEHQAQVNLEPGTGPQELGEDDRLDAMVDDCEGGDLRACDLLYFNTTEGSAYEDVAVSCGGADATEEGWCAQETLIDEGERFAPPDHPGLEVLASDCEGGDLTACDLLYTIAPAGSEAEGIGRTCGGRIAIGANPDCRTRFG